MSTKSASAGPNAQRTLLFAITTSLLSISAISTLPALKTCRAIREEIHSSINFRATFSFASPIALAKFALGPRANYHSSISKEVAETYGHRTLYHTAAGDLRVLRMAEGLVVFLDSGDAHIESVEQLMGLIVNSFKCAWRKEPLVPKSTGGGR
jgi:hypothetical protein